MQAKDDHVRSFTGDKYPEKALVELIWNSLDAEATNITISTVRNPLGGVEKVIVKDNGHGFNASEAPLNFGSLGGSWKRNAQHTKTGKRSLHGRKGRGRIRGLALGSEVSWESISESFEGGLERTIVKTNAENSQNFSVDHEPVSEDSLPGTIFTALNKTDRTLAQLENGVALKELLANFAPILISEPQLKIEFNGNLLDPTENFADNTTFELDLEDGKDNIGQLRIIRWKEGKDQKLLFGPDPDHFIIELEAIEFNAPYSFSAYVSSKAIDVDSVADITIGNLAEGSLGDLWKIVDAKLRQYLNAQTLRDRQQHVTTWKNQGIYPFTKPARNAVERAEQATFDTIAGTIAKHVPREKVRAKLTLQLLKTAMQNDPDDLHRILAEVINLSEYDRKTLTALLDETSLPNIIQSANTIARRIKVLAGLEALTLSGKASKPVKERQHLHMILEQELWVFGERFSVMTSERSLTDLLRTHVKLEGLPVDTVTPVTQPDGRTGRTDLHFAVRGREHDITRHLIVELKRPSVKATQTELSQVKQYGNTIASHPAFALGQSVWDIVLVVSDISPETKREITDHKTGQFAIFQQPNEPLVKMYVRTWASLIEENRNRLDFMNKSLNTDPGATDGLQHLIDQYPDYLPSEILDPEGEVA